MGHLNPDLYNFNFKFKTMLPNKKINLKLPERSCKPGSSIFIQVGDYGVDYEKRTIAQMIKDHYHSNLDDMKSTITRIFVSIYGESVPFKERITSEIWIKLKQIMQETGKTIEEVTRDIRNYLGYPCSFFRIDGARKLPIDSQRIRKAYELMKQRKSIVAVEDALYF